MYFTTISAIALFCLGWRTITDEGMILYFLRKPFENLTEEIENKQNIYNSMKGLLSKNDESEANSYIFKLKLLLFVLKPLILCITCMASIWGIPIYIYLNGISVEIIPCIISASFVQTFIWRLYEKL